MNYPAYYFVPVFHPQSFYHCPLRNPHPLLYPSLPMQMQPSPPPPPPPHPPPPHPQQESSHSFPSPSQPLTPPPPTPPPPRRSQSSRQRSRQRSSRRSRRRNNDENSLQQVEIITRTMDPSGFTNHIPINDEMMENINNLTQELVNNLQPNSSTSQNNISISELLEHTTLRVHTENDEEPLTCSICRSDITEGCIVRELRCSHVYHAGCIDQWLSTHSSCPMCREAIVVPDH